MAYAFETRLATKFFTPSPTERSIEFIVIHWWGGTGLSFDGVRNFLADPTKTREVSAHYVVQGADANGTPNPRVAQIVLDKDIAWHAGNWDANTKSIGIECRPEGSDADYNTVAELVRNLREKYGDIPVRAHKEFASTECPGTYDLSRIDRLARQETTVAHERTTWRGVIVCKHSVAKYNAWAASLGADILLKPLPGCGSYQTSTVASAGTHAGGGAIDVSLVNVPSTKRKWVADKGRTSGLQVSWHRNYVAGLWTWHAHALDPACSLLSKAAVSQCYEFANGGDGLVGTTPDGNTRVNAEELVRIFKNRLVATTDTIFGDAKVRLLQQAVHQTVDGLWGEQTDIDLRNTGAVAVEKYTGRYFKAWGSTQRKRMQKSWGTTQDGVWGTATASASKATTKKIQAALGVVQDGIWGTQTSTAYFALRAKQYKGSYPAKFPTVTTTTTAPKPAYDWHYPYQISAGWYPYPGKQGASYYGPNNAKYPWYSGLVGGGSNSSDTASGGLTKEVIGGHINRIRRLVGLTTNQRYDAALVTKVKAWQKAHGIAADGIVGPKTWAAMAKSKGQGK